MEELYRHGIFVGSNYTSGKRKGLHFLINDANIDDISGILDGYAKKEGVSFYVITTNKTDIESVKEKDNFFKQIDIIEGTTKEGQRDFDNALDNQIEVLDLAFLLLSRKEMTVEELQLFTFYCYFYYTFFFGRFPAVDKYYLLKDEKGFKKLNSLFKNVEPGRKIRCSKPNVVLSKYLNCEGGIEMMNAFLEIFYKILPMSLTTLKEKQTAFLAQCQSYIQKAKIAKGKDPYVVRRSLNSAFPYLDVGISFDFVKENPAS